MSEQTDLAVALGRAGVERARAAAKLRLANDELNGLVVEGARAGLTDRYIAELTGLSFGRVGQLVRFEGGDWRKGARRG